MGNMNKKLIVKNFNKQNLSKVSEKLMWEKLNEIFISIFFIFVFPYERFVLLYKSVQNKKYAEHTILLNRNNNNSITVHTFNTLHNILHTA